MRDPYYDRTLEAGLVIGKNSDGTYNVRIGDREEVYDSICSNDAMVYRPGDSVMVGAIAGDRNNVGIFMPSAYKAG